MDSTNKTLQKNTDTKGQRLYHDMKLEETLSLPFEFKVPHGKNNEGDDEKLLCHVCQKNITHMNEQRQQQHLNRCMDKAEKKNKKTSENEVLDCPICGKKLKTERQRKIHLKICGKSNGLKPQDLIEIIKKQESDTQLNEIEIPSLQIKPPEQSEPKQKRGKKKPATKTKPSWETDEELQVAMAISASLTDGESKNVVSDLFDRKTTKKKKRGGKTSKPLNLEMPVLLTRTDAERQTLTINTFSDILDWISDEEDEEGFTLPPSRLKKDPDPSAHSKPHVNYWNLASLAGKHEELMTKQTDKHPSESDKGVSILTQTTRTLKSTSEQNETEPNTCMILAELAEDHVTQSGDQPVFSSEPWHKNNLLECFSSLVDNEHMSDVKILCENDASINAHSFIIQLRCPDLHKSLLQDEGTLSCDLTTYSRSSVLAFIRYMYAADIDISVFVLPELIHLLKRYPMEGLKDLCQRLKQEDQEENDSKFISKDLDELMEGIEDDVVESENEAMSCSGNEEEPLDYLGSEDDVISSPLREEMKTFKSTGTPDNYIRTSENITKASDIDMDTPKKHVEILDICVGTPDKGIEFHDKGIGTPDKGVETPDKGIGTLDKGVGTPDKCVETSEISVDIIMTTPDKGVGTPDKFVETSEISVDIIMTTPDMCVATPDKCVAILDKCVGSPDKTSESCVDMVTAIGLDKNSSREASISKAIDKKGKSKSRPQTINLVDCDETKDEQMSFNCLASTPVVDNFKRSHFLAPSTSPIFGPVKSFSFPTKTSTFGSTSSRPIISDSDLNVSEKVIEISIQHEVQSTEENEVLSKTVNLTNSLVVDNHSKTNFNVSEKCVDLTIEIDKDDEEIVIDDIDDNTDNKKDDSKDEFRKEEDNIDANELTCNEHEFRFAYEEAGVWNISGDMCDLTGGQPNAELTETPRKTHEDLFSKKRLSEKSNNDERRKKQKKTDKTSNQGTESIDMNTSICITSSGTKLHQDALEFSCTQSFLLDLQSGKLDNDKLWGGCVVDLVDCQKTSEFKTTGTQKKAKPKKTTKKKEPNIPMPRVDALNTPGLKKELNQFGVKALSKKQSKTLLKEIYRQSDIEKGKKSEEVKQVSKPIDQASNSINQVSKLINHEISESDKSSSEGSESESTDEENSMREENLVCSPTKHGKDIDSLLSDFIKQCKTLHVRVLLYEAIDFTKLHQDVIASGIKCSKAFLIQFLDKKCINFRFTDEGGNSKRQRGPKKSRRKPKASAT
ncbi:uncharacterized protein [Antedon mediterranea]|uniref:uncharacterized protein n=1 Tax=Antedon mediterranea TaxID=105859 RepID=UPI003AF4C092